MKALNSYLKGKHVKDVTLVISPNIPVLVTDEPENDTTLGKGKKLVVALRSLVHDLTVAHKIIGQQL